MRQIWITRPGAPEVLEVRTAPDPDVGPGQVRIRVHAAGINFADLMARVGLYPDAPKLPSVLGYEVSGIVELLGEGVTQVRVGDRVMGGSHFGGYSEKVVTDAKGIIALPADWSFEEGAALPVNYATA